MQDVTCQMVGNDPKHINIVGNHAKQINKVGIDLKLGYNPKLVRLHSTRYYMGTSAEVI